MVYKKPANKAVVPKMHLLLGKDVFPANSAYTVYSKFLPDPLCCTAFFSFIKLSRT